MRAYKSYANLMRWRIKCLKIGMKPKVHREIYSKVKTLLVFFNRFPSKIEAKKMALILVGLPYCTTTFTFGLSVIFFSGLVGVTFAAFAAFKDTTETPELEGDYSATAIFLISGC